MKFHRRTDFIFVSFALVALLTASGYARAGIDADFSKESKQVAAQMVPQPFPITFGLTVGGYNEFIFRGVEILPDVDVNTYRASVNAINQDPIVKNRILGAGLTVPDFVTNSLGLSKKPTHLSDENGLVYVDGHMSAYGLTLGAFYANQANDFLGSNTPFNTYRELDIYLQYSHPVGPVNVSIGGTYYHLFQNSDFDTAELNFAVSYTPPKFEYVTATFKYNYAGAFQFSDYNAHGIKGEYLDGHYLEIRLDGNVPLYKKIVTFNPYMLVSAGSGILPRAFNALNLPTYYTTARLTQFLKPFYEDIVLNGQGGAGSATTLGQATQRAFDPSGLDRSFDLSNFQVGFRVPIYLTRWLSLRGEANYSRPLGNLDRAPYSQRDNIWGGGSVTVSF